MGLVTTSVILAALLGPDFLPPAPLVLFTEIDRTGRELGDSFHAPCGGDACRASFVIDFAGATCVVNAEVKLPLRDHHGSMLFSVSPCAPDSTPVPNRNLGQSADFELDLRGTATKVVTVPRMGGCAPPFNDLVERYCDYALVRVDIVLWTTARP